MFKYFKKRITKNKKNVLKISTGTIIGQIISIITLPIIARLYGPDVIGIWALLLAISNIVNSFSDLGMTHTIMIEEEENIDKTYKVISTVVIIISLISSIIFLFYYYFFTERMLNHFFLFIFVLFLFITTKQIQICYTWLNRKSEYDILMKNPIINNGVYSITAIILGLLGMTTYGYFIGHMVGQLLTLLHMKKKLPKGLITFAIEDYKTYIPKNKKFIKYQMPANITSNIKSELPTLLIGSLWGAQILGYYSITTKVLKIPSTLLANAIGRVFFQVASSLKREGKRIAEYVLRNIKKGMVIASLPIFLLMSFGDVIVIVFLGEDWSITGDFIQILALQFLFMFMMNTIQGLSTILEKQHFAMVASILQTIGVMLGLFVGKYLLDNIHWALILMALFFIIIHIGYISSLFKVMGVSRRKYIIYSLVCITVVIIASFLTRKSFELMGIIDSLFRILNLM